MNKKSALVTLAVTLALLASFAALPVAEATKVAYQPFDYGVDGKISGHITDADGAPISGATVTLTLNGILPYWNTNAAPVDSTSDAAGYYEFTNVAYGSNWNLQVTADGYDDASASISGWANDGPGKNGWTHKGNAYSYVKNFQLSAIVLPTFVVFGVVVDEAAEAVSGATVSLAGLTVTTDETGAYSFAEVTVGTYDITASAYSYVDKTYSITLVDKDLWRHFILVAAPTYSVSGVVVNVDDEPIANAAVTLGDVTVYTDAEGAYTFDGLLAGDYVVSASADGYFSNSVSVTVSDDDVVAEDIVLSIEAYSVSGIVYDADTNEAIPDATVALGNKTTTTNEAGEYAFEGVVPGTYDVVASADGYFSNNVSVTVSANTTDADIALTLETYVISGVVTDVVTGAPIENAAVTIGDETVYTDAEGAYSLTVVPGDYAISVSADGYLDEVNTADVSVSNSDVAQDFALRHDAVVENVINTPGTWSSSLVIGGFVNNAASGEFNHKIDLVKRWNGTDLIVVVEIESADGENFWLITVTLTDIDADDVLAFVADIFVEEYDVIDGKVVSENGSADLVASLVTLDADRELTEDVPVISFVDDLAKAYKLIGPALA